MSTDSTTYVVHQLTEQDVPAELLDQIKVSLCVLLPNRLHVNYNQDRQRLKLRPLFLWRAADLNAHRVVKWPTEGLQVCQYLEDEVLEPRSLAASSDSGSHDYGMLTRYLTALHNLNSARYGAGLRATYLQRLLLLAAVLGIGPYRLAWNLDGKQPTSLIMQQP